MPKTRKATKPRKLSAKQARIRELQFYIKKNKDIRKKKRANGASKQELLVYTNAIKRLIKEKQKLMKKK
jgi:hypothetical protein